jgi:hypothetical protein
MTTFEDRERDFENRFKHDQELAFKVTARRNRMLGLWAAQKLGLSGEAVDAYVKEVVEAQFDRAGDHHVVDKVAADCEAKGVGITPAQVRFELHHFMRRAKEEIMKE